MSGLRRRGTLAARIAYHARELRALRQQQRDTLRAAIVDAFPREVFSAEQIWQRADLQAACRAADITTVLLLGTFLRSWCGAGLWRIDRTNRGIVWSVGVDDLHQDPSGGLDDEV